MCRLLGWVSRPELTLREVLGEESFVAFAQLSRIHADGWGLSDGVTAHRSTTNASTDPEFTRVAGGVATRAAVAHLRWASPGLPVELRNAHPFVTEGTAFAHNGAVYPFDRLDELLPAPWRARLTGTTDSEHYHLAILAERAAGADEPTAIRRALVRITEGFTPSSLNAMLLTPEALHVINCHDASLHPVLPPPEQQSVDQLVEATEEEAPYYDLRYRCTDDAVVVASSGFAQPEGGGWRRMEANSLLTVDRRTLQVTETPLDVRVRGAAEVARAGADLR
jgi:predicted glutamine amidotransferase